MRKLFIISSFFISLASYTQYNNYRVYNYGSNYQDTVLRKDGTDSLFRLEGGQYVFAGLIKTKVYIDTAEVVSLRGSLSAKQDALGFTPKSITDSGRTASNYATGGSLNKVRDSITALYGNDYRAANFVAGTNYLAPNGSAALLTNFPTFNQNTTGSAATLTTSRTINGVSFNGSANITVPSDITPSTSGNILTSNGSVWTSAANNGGWTTLRVSGSNATTTGQSLVDITGLVTGTLSNATLYEVEAVLYVSTTNVTTGTQYAFTANGTGGAATVFINVSGTTTTNAATTVTQSASGTAAGTFLTTASSSGIIVMKGFILTRGSGTATIALQHLKITSGTSTVFIGSVLRYRLAS